MELNIFLLEELKRDWITAGKLPDPKATGDHYSLMIQQALLVLLCTVFMAHHQKL